MSITLLSNTQWYLYAYYFGLFRLIKQFKVNLFLLCWTWMNEGLMTPIIIWFNKKHFLLQKIYKQQKKIICPHRRHNSRKRKHHLCKKTEEQLFHFNSLEIRHFSNEYNTRVFYYRERSCFLNTCDNIEIFFHFLEIWSWIS